MLKFSPIVEILNYDLMAIVTIPFPVQSYVFYKLKNHLNGSQNISINTKEHVLEKRGFKALKYKT